jgi:molecular chaperone IbpA
MTNLTSYDFSPLNRTAIGIDRLMSHMVRNFENTQQDNYPPYNIVEDSENEFTLEIAVAGFKKGDISITSQDGQLTVTGEKQEEDNRKYTWNKIATRKFNRTFTLGEYVEVTGASQEDGILSIKLERIVPEAMKPKAIAIDYKG